MKVHLETKSACIIETEIKQNVVYYIKVECEEKQSRQNLYKVIIFRYLQLLLCLREFYLPSFNRFTNYGLLQDVA